LARLNWGDGVGEVGVDRQLEVDRFVWAPGVVVGDEDGDVRVEVQAV
jgi:hypothetical protein